MDAARPAPEPSPRPRVARLIHPAATDRSSLRVVHGKRGYRGSRWDCQARKASCGIPDTGMDQDFIVGGRKDAADVSLQQAQLDECGHVGRDLLVRPSEG